MSRASIGQAKDSLPKPLIESSTKIFENAEETKIDENIHETKSSDKEEGKGKENNSHALK